MKTLEELKISPAPWKIRVKDMMEENAKLKARLETVVKGIDRQVCHPSESNCKRCGYHRGNCQCGSISNNEMMKLLKFARGE